MNLGKNIKYLRNKNSITQLTLGEILAVSQTTIGDYEKRIYKLFSWRHTGVVWAWKAGIDLVQLQMQLGHTEITTTMEYLKNLGLQDLAKLKANFPAI